MNLILALLILIPLAIAAVLLRICWSKEPAPREGMRCARCQRVLFGAGPYRYTTCALCREDGD